MGRFARKKLCVAVLCGLFAGAGGAAFGQDAPVTDEDSTVTYPAEFFSQYEPFSVNDMLDRIPGINVARGGGGGGGGGGPGFSGGSNRRGLGMGGDQVLINGRRIAGKENEGSSQLARIPASQVDYIEIIRGTSGDLDVRGGAQVINIVLLEAESRSTVTYEVNTDHYHDDALKPGGKVALTGSRGAFEYLVSAESEPRYEHRIGHETSILADGSPNERLKRVSTRRAQPVVLSSNLAWQPGDADLFHLNLQYENNDSPEEANRDILNTRFDPPLVDLEQDVYDRAEDFWEVGGDYEHIFGGGQRWKTLFIVNRRDDHSLRDRYLLEVNGDDRTRDLHLDFANTYQERILRSGYTFDFASSGEQSLEIGIERAQTILDSNLQLDLLLDGTGLTPVSFSDATVEEIRYESFAVHNWQINDRMSLESTLIFEQSEIAQSGDVSKSRDFEFLRPKVDYRFDITPSLQFRATVEKDVAQLSFSDFTANTNESDDDQDALAGNPDLRQEQSWRYDVNLEYRFNDDNGVLNTNLFYHELIDVIDRVDVSTPTTIQSANGNIGDGERYGMALDGSYRFASFTDSQILLTSRLQVEDSNVVDPFLGIGRRFSRQGRGEARIGFRQDFPSRNFNYGMNWSHNFRDGRIVYDIDKIESYNSGDFVRLFAETQGWGPLVYRLEVFNPFENKRCRVRSRYLGGTIATGYLNEIEDSCSHTGPTIAIKIRGTI